ncbi:MAG: DNA polymerase/3'-5' exonuclease PolX [Cyclobacteriaceae bacterium]|nr:DNA polymerase/3'-5' exonuclease PolX [Cyclobacteriaceae bacterium]
MKNKEIIKLLNTTVSYMELHGENDFKIKSYTNAIYNLERCNEKLEKLDLPALEKIDGVGKSIAAAIDEINSSGAYSKLNELAEQTPHGLRQLMKLRGLGAKKIRTLWTELNVENIDTLEKAIASGEVTKLKGFGAKTVDNITELLSFAKETEGWVHYAEAEKLANELKEEIKNVLPEAKVEVVGKLRRKWEVINQLEFVIGHKDFSKIDKALEHSSQIKKEPDRSGPFTWRGTTQTEDTVQVVLYYTTPENFTNSVFLNTGSPLHLSQIVKETTLKELAETNLFDSEQAIYSKLGLEYCEPEIREGTWELDEAKANKLPSLIQYDDLKGVLHNHSTYSDGENTLEEMIAKCKEMGYSYLGISDHSKAAHFYANGMYENTVKEQQEEIDQLNKKHAPFKVFKGIEADILPDGNLDYDAKTLASFDFVVASIHSSLAMDEEKATQRLLTAIANPYTTILGHMTGRLLLMRKGYTVDHKAIIDACAEHGVIIEINAHPKRLDIDWRWVHYALEKGVILSVNPDAHATDGFKDMYYGVCVGRKGGLTKEKTLNAWDLNEVESYFKKRKEKVSA